MFKWTAVCSNLVGATGPPLHSIKTLPEQGLEHVVVHGAGSCQAENLEEQCAAELEQNLGGRDASIDGQVPQGPMWSATCMIQCLVSTCLSAACH